MYTVILHVGKIGIQISIDLVSVGVFSYSVLCLHNGTGNKQRRCCERHLAAWRPGQVKMDEVRSKRYTQLRREIWNVNELRSRWCRFSVRRLYPVQLTTMWRLFITMLLPSFTHHDIRTWWLHEKLASESWKVKKVFISQKMPLINHFI